MGFKEAIQEYGKEITASFVCNGVTYSDEDIISMNPHFEGSLLTSVMKCLDIEIKRSAVGDDATVVGVSVVGEAVVGVSNIGNSSIIQTPKFGVKAPGDADYFYKEYGTYIIKEKKVDEEQGTILLECYDLMLQAMIPFDLVLVNPETATEENPTIKVRALLDAICDRFGWQKGYEQTGFSNQDILIKANTYDANYTFRDVLDEIAQVSCKSIVFEGDLLCFANYFNDTRETIDASNLKTLKIGKVYGPVNSLVLARTPQEDNIYRRNEESIAANGLTEFRIENNQIIEQHRDSVIDAMFSNLGLIKFTLYELESYGIGYLNFGDVFTIKTPDGELHRTIMLCDDLKITQGLTETSRLEAPKVVETDYSAASKTDRALNQTILKVDKQAGDITALVTKTNNLASTVDGLNGTVTNLTKITMDSEKVDLAITEAIKGVNSITTTTGYTFDKNGLHIQKSVDGVPEEMENLLDNTGMYVNRGGDNILTANNEGVDAINLRSRQFLIIGDNSRFENYGTGRTACFYIGGS